MKVKFYEENTVMARRRYTIESDDYEIDGLVCDSVYEYQQAAQGKDSIAHEEVYNVDKDEWEYTGTIIDG